MYVDVMASARKLGQGRYERLVILHMNEEIALLSLEKKSEGNKQGRRW